MPNRHPAGRGTPARSPPGRPWPSGSAPSKHVRWPYQVESLATPTRVAFLVTSQRLPNWPRTQLLRYCWSLDQATQFCSSLYSGPVGTEAAARRPEPATQLVIWSASPPVRSRNPPTLPGGEAPRRISMLQPYENNPAIPEKLARFSATVVDLECLDSQWV